MEELRKVSYHQNHWECRLHFLSFFEDFQYARVLVYWKYHIRVYMIYSIAYRQVECWCGGWTGPNGPEVHERLPAEKHESMSAHLWVRKEKMKRMYVANYWLALFIEFGGVDEAADQDEASRCRLRSREVKIALQVEMTSAFTGRYRCDCDRRYHTAKCELLPKPSTCQCYHAIVVFILHSS